MGNFSGDTFNKLKHYVSVRLQQGVPIVDTDWNEAFDIRKYELQAFLKWFVGNGVPKGNHGFRILDIQTPDGGCALDNFRIMGGDGTADGAGRCIVEGWDVMNESEISYTAQPLYHNPGLAKAWQVLELEGLNTLSPGNDKRLDLVYLDVWEREVDSREDYDHLVHSDIGIETCVRLKREWVVRVHEGIPLAVDKWAPPENIVLDRHVYYPLALLVRERVWVPETLPGTEMLHVEDLRRTGLAVLSEEITIEDGKVGIGTTEPEAKLDVDGNLVVRGKVGIGTTEPEAKLDVDDDLVVRGKVGIGTTEPEVELHVDGNVQIGEIPSVDSLAKPCELNIYGPLKLRTEGHSLSMETDSINCEARPLSLNPFSGSRVIVGNSSESGEYAMTVCGDLEVTGTVDAGGPKRGYVTDRFINQSGDILEQGDIVILGGRAVKDYCGANDDIPVPEVDATTNAYDRRVCGIVCQIIAEELQEIDRKKIGEGQIGEMVTLGCFAHCKVDADIAPIEVGDLLTTSPTKGHAQKALEPEKAVGAIVGKALGALEEGKGKIPVLVMLQ